MFRLLFTKQRIEDQVKALCKKNNCEDLARIRLSVSRGSGGLYDCDNKFSYLIECWPLEQKGFNENGLIIDIFPDAKKSIDVFSNLKSANYLPYVMAAIWAKENKLNDALILNQHDRICDSTIANVFWVKDNKIFTPPLNEGCVAGVMRKKILELATRNSDHPVQEAILTQEILLQADEVFLTNAITGIRWVKECRGKVYKNTISSKIFTDTGRNNLIKPRVYKIIQLGSETITKTKTSIEIITRSNLSPAGKHFCDIGFFFGQINLVAA